MQAGPRTVQALLHSPDQFIIPLFQRTYAWHRKDWQRLWSDLIALQEPGAPREHFMGALVCMPTSHEPGKPPQYLVIDGQQRLTTLYLLLCALRDAAAKAGGPELSAEIGDDFLVHRHRKGLDRYKVLPRLRDRQTLFAIVDGQPPAVDADRIAEAYQFFLRQIESEAAGQDSAGMVAVLHRLYSAAIARLTTVMITLEEENAFQIFETLNSTGQPLDQADLVRNHVFMHVDLGEQDSFDDQQWRPMEESLMRATPTPVQLGDFYRDFLMQRGTYIRPDAVYAAFREFFVPPPERLAETLAQHAERYLWIQYPERAPDVKVGRELDQLRRLGVTTARPLLMRLLDLWAHRISDADEVSRCLRAVQSFVIRRAVTRESTRGYGVLFAAAARAVEEHAAFESLTAYLAARGWPTDALFANELVTFPLYRRTPDIARVVLMALEAAMDHREVVAVGQMLDDNTLQLEHVLPQGIAAGAGGDAWRSSLGSDFEVEHARWVHTLGNLTLSGYNQPLSNHPFAEKRKLLANSHLELNREVAQATTWDQMAIRARGEALAKRVVDLWPGPLSGTLPDRDTTPGGTAATPPTGEVRRDSWRNYPTVEWTQVDIERFKREVRNPTVRAMMELTSATPGDWVSLRSIESAAGRTQTQVRGDLAGLTMIVKSRFRRRNWPCEAGWAAGGEQQFYYRSLSEDHARWWREA